MKILLLSLLFLSGCATNQDIQVLEAHITSLNVRLDGLDTRVKALSDLQADTNRVSTNASYESKAALGIAIENSKRLDKIKK